jgi:P pilus assembly chaperone PapD
MQKCRFSGQPLIIFIVFFVSFNLLLNVRVTAQGNINISPGRVIFDGQKKIMELNLTNGDHQDSAKYTISFVQIRMTEDGVFQWINDPDPGQKFADKFIRVFPRIVRLGPNDTQVVRLQLTRSDQLENGEYRSHLYFKSMVPQKALGAEDIKKDSNAMFNIEMTFGITVPVIIRVGEPTTMLNISDIKMETSTDGFKKLNLNLNRTGNMSVYGEVSAIYVAQNGKETQIGLLKNVAVYTPNLLLRVKVDIDTKQNVDLTKGKIRVVFSAKSGTRNEKLAEAELVL